MLSKWNLVNTSMLYDKHFYCFWFNVGDWTRVPGLFTILLKQQYNQIWPFFMTLIHVFKIMKHWKLVIIGWVIGAPVLQIVQTIPENYCSCYYLSIGEVWWLKELWFKRYVQKCILPYVLTLIMTSQIW